MKKVPAVRCVVITVLVLSAAAALLLLRTEKPGSSRPRAGTVPDPPGPPWFSDVTDEVGLDFVHDAGPVDDNYFMPQIIGSGAALFDFNNDGLLDVYLLQNGGPKGAKNRLFRQIAGGRFKDVSAGSGLDIAGYNMGVAAGDINNDGWPDLVVTQYGGVKLFLNNGDGTFKDVTAQAGLKNPDWGVSAAFLDFDRDGWLDLVIVNYVAYDAKKACRRPGEPADYCGPNTFPGQVTRLFRNLGPATGVPGKAVRFEDVTVKSGLAGRPGPGLGVVCADFDGDGWPDILVANDGQPNCLWINRHDGRFADEAVARGLAYNRMGQSEAGMGIAVGDVNNDDLFDVVITHLTHETLTLWSQYPRGLFSDRTPLTGLGRPRWRGTGFGAVFGDFDQDGALDLAVVNGRVMMGKPPANAVSRWDAYAERNQLFANEEGSGSFQDVSLDNPAFCGTPNLARGLAYGDVNGDGALDLLVTTVGGKARLYRNVAPKRGHWLLVRTVDAKLGGRDAYGAEVRVRAGKQSWLALMNPASSYLCANDVRAHFGLGTAKHVDAIEVRWPDGTAEVFPGCGVDQNIVLSKGAGSPRK